MRKVYITFTGTIILRADEDVEISKVLEEAKFSMEDRTEKANVEDFKIDNWNITDSK